MEQSTVQSENYREAYMVQNSSNFLPCTIVSNDNYRKNCIDLKSFNSLCTNVLVATLAATIFVILVAGLLIVVSAGLTCLVVDEIKGSKING